MKTTSNPLDSFSPISQSIAISKLSKVSTQAQYRIFLLGLIISDMVMIGLAFRLAFFARFQLDLPLFVTTVNPNLDFYQRVFLSLLPVWLVLFWSFGLYNQRYLLGGTQEYARVFRAVTTGMMMLVVTGFLEPAFIIARGWLLLAWGLAFVLVAGGRFTLRRLVYYLRRHGYFLVPAIIVGANDEGRSLAEQLFGWRTSGLNVLGFVDDGLPAGAPIYRQLNNLGSLARLDEIIQRYGVQELIIATSALSREDMLAVFKQYGFKSSVNLRLSSGLFELITTGLEVKELAYVPLVRVQNVRLTGADRLLKLALDYSLTVPAVILLLPVYALLALLVRLDSPGPIIYRRRVMGLNGSEFDAFKFRTMYVNGDEILEQYPALKAKLAKDHKLKKDPRVTRLGAFLRKYSLDELPQLFNVLRHEMSLVGPRMIFPDEMANYGQWGYNLLTVLPGITGLWQVSGRSDVRYEERVRLDMYYIRNWTIWLDLQLLLRTIPVVLRGRGAY